MYINVLNGGRMFCLIKYKSCFDKINVNKILGWEFFNNVL